MTIDYLGHSGFLVEMANALLLFDYFRGDISFIEKRRDDKPLFVFVSHAHADHFNPKIFSLSTGNRSVKYLLSFDINASAVPDGIDASFLVANGLYSIDGLGTVRTLTSTDEGVAFLVLTTEVTLFHSGDLNWWDWPGEDGEWLAEQKAVFAREIGKLENTPIDAAFVVLDDRLEENYAKGMELFLSVCRARFVLPMHFKSADAVQSFIHLNKQADTVILDTSSEKHWEIKEIPL